MSGDTEHGLAGWHDDEVGSAGLPDKRLARRLHRLLEQMSGKRSAMAALRGGGSGIV
ncbi:MAG: hypothetical protein HEQ16_13020 [Bosea sp.]|nr:hypothetical protein [Bosea sp. (in: a-proteobacteria)]